LLEVSPSCGVRGEPGPHLGPGESITEGASGGGAGPGGRSLGLLRIGQTGLEGLVVGVDFEALFVSRNGVVVLGETEMRGAETTVALGPVGFELNSLLGVD